MGFGIENDLLPDLGTTLGGHFLDDLLGTEKNTFPIDDILKSVDLPPVDDKNIHQAEKIVTQNKAQNTIIANNDLEMQTDFGKTTVTEDKINRNNHQSHHVYPQIPARLPVLHPQRSTNSVKRKLSVHETTLAITQQKTALAPKRVKYDIKCPERDQLRTENNNLKRKNQELEYNLKRKNQELEYYVNMLTNKNQKIVDAVLKDHACKINRMLCMHCKRIKIDDFEYKIVEQEVEQEQAQKYVVNTAIPFVSDKISSSEVIPKSSRRRNRC
jgi:hypothetical protein